MKMKSKLKRKTEIILTLTSNEANWLREAMQNPCYKNEAKKDHKIRNAFWQILTYPEEEENNEIH